MTVGARSLTARVERALVGLALLTIATAGVLVIRQGSALGWDESVYAIASRNILQAHPAIGVVRPYRPPGLPVLATVAALNGFADPALRFVSLTLGILTLASAWLLGRLVFGARAAILGLVACVAAPGVFTELAKFHNDLAAAGAMLLLMALLWYEFEVRPAPGKMLMLAAPLAAGGFYVRYGILAALLGIVLSACILWWREMLARKLLVGATVVLTLLLVAPHTVWATIETGRPWGIVTSAADVVNTSSPLDSLVSYTAWMPIRIAGPITVGFVAAGVLLVAIAGVRRFRGLPSHGLGRPVAWLAVPALLAAAGTITIAHAEARYVLFSIVLATLIGAEAIGRGFDFLTARSPGLRRHGSAPAVTAGLALGTAVVVILGVQVWRVRGDANGHWYADPSRAIAMVADRPCVVATSMPPMVGWYSGCRPVTLKGTTPEELLAMRFASHWVVVTSADGDRASDEARARFQALLRQQPLAQWEQGSAYGRAYQVDP